MLNLSIFCVFLRIDFWFLLTDSKKITSLMLLPIIKRVLKFPSTPQPFLFLKCLSLIIYYHKKE